MTLAMFVVLTGLCLIGTIAGIAAGIQGPTRAVRTISGYDTRRPVL